jgi:hypothetical protein
MKLQMGGVCLPGLRRREDGLGDVRSLFLDEDIDLLADVEGAVGGSWKAIDDL